MKCIFPGGEAVICFLLLLLSSCTQDLVRPSGPDGETVPVRLSIATAPMQASGEPVTRAATDKTRDELAVHTTWLLQFNGNAPASRLLKAEEVTFTNNTLETELLHTDATCRFYVVANSDCSAFAMDAAAGNGISLTDFEASLSAFAATKAIDPGKGLPMSACQDFNPRTDAPASAFTLKPLVAKLTFKLDIDPGFTGFTVNSVTLKQVAAGASYGEVAAGEAAVRPAGATYTGELDLASADASAVTCYLPENLSGRNTGLKYMSERGGANAPENATYVEVSGAVTGGNGYTYSFFLGDGTAADFNVTRNVHYNLVAKLNGTSLADQRTELIFTDLNAGGETANCYLVYRNEMKYSFDATVMGNGATTLAGGFPNSYDIIPRPLAPQSVKVLWETGTVAGTVVSEVKLSSDKTKVQFKTGTKAGNAVIAVYDSANTDDPNAKILWSWHIWKPADAVSDLEVQKYVDNNNPPTTAKFFMMDRNLGATVATAGADGAWGLMYQWGRKDPFPGAKGKSTYEFMATTPTLATGNQWNDTKILGTDVSLADNAACLAYAIENPTTFFKYNGSWRSDWIKDQQDNLWGNPWEGGKKIYSNSSETVNSGYGSKSIYDPCPVGYRVAPQDTWTALLKGDGTKYGNGKDDPQSMFDATTKVWSSTSISPTGATVSFPASGYVNGSRGSFGGVGGSGFYWCSSPYSGTSDKVNLFYFSYSGYLYQVYFYPQPYGNSVRCVKE